MKNPRYFIVNVILYKRFDGDEPILNNNRIGNCSTIFVFYIYVYKCNPIAREQLSSDVGCI